MFDQRMFDVVEAQRKDRLARAAQRQQFAHLYRSQGLNLRWLGNGIIQLRNLAGYGLILIGERLLAQDATAVMAASGISAQSQTSESPCCP